MQKMDWNDLWLYLVYYISTSCTNHIFRNKTWDLVDRKPLEGSKMCYY